VWEQLQKVELAQQRRRQQNLDDKLGEAQVRARADGARADGFRIVFQSVTPTLFFGVVGIGFGN
jgi:hypothetical protein